MRRKDISFEFTNINSKLIEEAAEYRYSNKKLIRVLALAACIAVLVTAIPLSLIMNREDQVQTPETTQVPDTTTNDVIVEPKPIKVVYCDANTLTLEELRQKVFKDKEVSLEEFERFYGGYQWTQNRDTQIERSEDIPEKISFTVGNKEYTGIFDLAFYANTNTTDETLKSLTKFARYKIEGTDYGVVTYRVATKKIVDIDNLHSDLPNGPITDDKTPIDRCTPEEFEAIALRDIKSIHGDTVASNYSITHSFSVGDYYHSHYMITFEWSIGGYSLGTGIRMVYNYQGDLIYMTTGDFGILDVFEPLLNEKKLLETEKEAQELIGDRLVSKKYLEIHSDGYLCICYQLYLGIDEKGHPIDPQIFYRLE